MFFIPGEIISALTFPGIILHEWAHEVFCKWLGVKVHEVKYFQIGEKVAGYVIHEQPTTYKQTFWISVGPLLVNSLVTVLLSFIASQTVSDGWLMYVLFWLAISAGMHSFPSDHDMEHIKVGSKNALKEGGSFFHYLAFPFVWLIWIGNKLRVVWFDAIWAFILISIGGGFTTITNDVTNDQQSNLSAQIDACRSTLTDMEKQINNDGTNLENMDSKLTQYKKDGDETSYNNLVDPYNNLLDKIKEESSNYDTRLAECNNIIDQYNASL